MTKEKRDAIMKVLRRASYRWPPRYNAKAQARVSRGIYRCNICKGENFKDKEVQLDHIEPVAGPLGFIDFNDFIERLFVDASGYQVICKPCHKVKSVGENAQRRENKKKVLDKDTT